MAARPWSAVTSEWDVTTTGTFTPAAVKEATRDGAPPIDLLDGSDVADKLRELSLGVRIENIEVVRIEEQWFESV
jgi:restriction system protein